MFKKNIFWYFDLRNISFHVLNSFSLLSWCPNFFVVLLFYCSVGLHSFVILSCYSSFLLFCNPLFFVLFCPVVLLSYWSVSVCPFFSIVQLSPDLVVHCLVFLLSYCPVFRQFCNGYFTIHSSLIIPIVVQCTYYILIT